MLATKGFEDLSQSEEMSDQHMDKEPPAFCGGILHSPGTKKPSSTKTK